MTKPADIASWVHRLVWRRGIDVLQTRLSSPSGSRVLKIIGFLVAALVSVKICSQASVPDGSGNLSSDEVLAHEEVLAAPPAPTSVSVVPKMPRLPSPAASKAGSFDSHNAMTSADLEASLFSGETVSSKMLMMGFSVAPTETAAPPVSPVTSTIVKPKPKQKLKPKPTAKKPPTEKESKPKLSWWQRLPGLSLP